MVTTSVITEQLEPGSWMIIVLTPVIIGILAIVLVAALVGPKR